MKPWFERSFSFDLPTWMFTNLVERLPGVLDADTFNENLATGFAQTGTTLHRRLSEAELSRIRTTRDQLFNAWVRLDPDATLNLTFDAPAPAST